jgi:hypothetical protein
LSSINSNFGALFRYLAKSINYKGLAVMFYNCQAFGCERSTESGRMALIALPNLPTRLSVLPDEMVDHGM